MVPYTGKSRRKDSLELFEQIVSCPFFDDKPIFLLLNKADRMAEKLKSPAALEANSSTRHLQHSDN